MPYESRAVDIADFTQLALDENISHQEVTNSSTTLATVVGVEEGVTAGELWTTIYMYHAFIEEGANTNPQSFFVQTNPAATGNDEGWNTVMQFTTTDATTVEENMTATEAAGVTELAIANSTGFANGDYIYIEDNPTVADSESSRCVRSTRRRVCRGVLWPRRLSAI